MTTSRSVERLLRAGLVALAVPVWLAGAPALAQTKGGAGAGGAGASGAGAGAGGAGAKAAPKPADKRDAQKLLGQGNQLVGEGDYLGALEKFKGAYQKFASPKILLNIGTTLRQLGRNVEAAEVYEQYLKDPEHDAAREKDVQRVLGEIDAVVGHLVITVDDPAATLRLDGKQIEPFAKGESRRVDPGEHTVMAEKPGAAPAVQSIVVKPRQEHLVTLRFTAPPPSGPPPSNTQRTVGLVLGGVGAASLLTGVIVGGVAVSQGGAAGAHCYQGGNACDQQGVDLDRSAKAAATASTITFAVGGGLLAAGALIWVLAPQPRKDAAPPQGVSWLSVQPRLGGASVGIGGAF